MGDLRESLVNAIWASLQSAQQNNVPLDELELEFRWGTFVKIVAPDEQTASMASIMSGDSAMKLNPMAFSQQRVAYLGLRSDVEIGGDAFNEFRVNVPESLMARAFTTMAKSPGVQTMGVVHLVDRVYTSDLRDTRRIPDPPPRNYLERLGDMPVHEQVIKKRLRQVDVHSPRSEMDYRFRVSTERKITRDSNVSTECVERVRDKHRRTLMLPEGDWRLDFTEAADNRSGVIERTMELEYTRRFTDMPSETKVREIVNDACKWIAVIFDAMTPNYV
jgi:hypothetical protein